MYKLFLISIIFINSSCTSRLSHQELAYELIITTINSNPVGKYKSYFLETYQPYSDYFFSPSQQDNFLNDDHVARVTLHSGNDYYFDSTFLNDTCVSIGFYFYEPIDSSTFISVKNVIKYKFGLPKESQRDRTGGHLSIPADIHIYEWNINGNITSIEYTLDSKSIDFEMGNNTVKQRIEKIIFTKIPAPHSHPELISKPNILIPDSIMAKYQKV